MITQINIKVTIPKEECNKYKKIPVKAYKRKRKGKVEEVSGYLRKCKIPQSSKIALAVVQR